MGGEDAPGAQGGYAWGCTAKRTTARGKFCGWKSTAMSHVPGLGDWSEEEKGKTSVNIKNVKQNAISTKQKKIRSARLPCWKWETAGMRNRQLSTPFDITRCEHTRCRVLKIIAGPRHCTIEKKARGTTAGAESRVKKGGGAVAARLTEENHKGRNPRPAGKRKHTESTALREQRSLKNGRTEP